MISMTDLESDEECRLSLILSKRKTNNSGNFKHQSSNCVAQ